MNDQKFFIDYLAYISDRDNIVDELGNMNNLLSKHYSNIELAILYKMLIDQLNVCIKDNTDTLHVAHSFGTSSMLYDFAFDGKRLTRDISMVINSWKYAVAYFEELVKMPNMPKLILKFDELPDFLNYEEMKDLTTWSKKTIQTKHSKLELASVEGSGLTPKQGLLDYYQKRIKGVQIDPEKWFNDTLRKNKVLPKK